MGDERELGRATRVQVERALKKILESEVFTGGLHYKKPEKLASLLKHIVTEALAGKRVDENSLLIDFYKLTASQLKEDNNIARKGVARLRDKLREYYATFGLDDLVTINIPLGGYHPEFAHYEKSRAQKEVTLGFHHVDRETPDNINIALTHFNKAIELEPEYSEGYAGKASALLTMTLHAYDVDPTDLYAQAEQNAAHAVAWDKNSWRGYANLGAVYQFRHEWERADEAFTRAKQISPFEIDSIGGYGPYLLSRGKYDEGIALAHRYADEGFDKPVLLVRAGLYLYALRQFDQAEVTLRQALALDAHFWRGHMILAFVLLATNKPDEALAHMERVKPLAGKNLWPGLKVLCLERADRSNEAEKEFALLQEASDGRYVQPMQLALGSMALGAYSEAIEFLSRSCDEFDPFTAWLHLWSFLDPLRRFPEFRALIRKWRFPAN